MLRNDFEEALEQHREFLFAYSLKRCGNRADAQDLFQESIARGFRFRDRFEPGSNFRAWMATIITRMHLTLLRRSKKYQVVNEPIDHFLFALGDTNIVNNQGEQKIQLEEYQQVIDQLKDKYRIPFLLFAKGYEYQEIADILGIPIGTVKSRLHTARKKLQHLIPLTT